MSLERVRKDLREIKRVHAPEFKTIEELLNTKKEDIHKLSNADLFRVIQYFNPEFKTEAELTTEVLEKMVKGEYP